MNLDAVLDQAWDFLGKALKDKQAMAQESLKQTERIAAEREKTERMKITSQEKIQMLINNGAFDRQELVNQGLMTQQQMESAGLLDRQESANTAMLAGKDKDYKREMAVQDQTNKGALDVATVRSEQGVKEAEQKRLADREGNNYVLTDESADGVKTQRVFNPYAPDPLSSQIDELIERGRVGSAPKSTTQQPIQNRPPIVPPVPDVNTTSSPAHTPFSSRQPVSPAAEPAAVPGVIGGPNIGNHIQSRTITPENPHTKKMKENGIWGLPGKYANAYSQKLTGHKSIFDTDEKNRIANRGY